MTRDRVDSAEKAFCYTGGFCLPTNVLPTGVWVLVVIRKPNGSSQTVRMSWYNMNSPGWTHQDASPTADNLVT